MEMSTETGQAVAPDLEELSRKYIALRDKKDEVAKRHKDELRPYNAALEKLEAFFLETLNDNGLQSLSTQSATIFRGTHTSVTAAEWDKTLEFIIENGRWDLLDKRVNKTIVNDMAEQGELVPGVNIRKEAYARVNRKS
jgi:hypothetical protein